MLVSVPAVVSAVIWRGIRVGTRCGRTVGRATWWQTGARCVSWTFRVSRGAAPVALLVAIRRRGDGGTAVVTRSLHVLRSLKADLIVAVKALCWALVKGGSVVAEGVLPDLHGSGRSLPCLCWHPSYASHRCGRWGLHPHPPDCSTSESLLRSEPEQLLIWASCSDCKWL